MISKKQFKGFSLSGFQDEYVLECPLDMNDIEGKISKYFVTRKATRIQGENLSFTRGSKIWTWLNFWSEFWPYQLIRIRLRQNSVELTYSIIGGLWLRTPPYQLEKEALELEKVLNET